jgi:hypothetical protein
MLDGGSGVTFVTKIGSGKYESPSVMIVGALDPAKGSIGSFASCLLISSNFDADIIGAWRYGQIHVNYLSVWSYGQYSLAGVARQNLNGVGEKVVLVFMGHRPVDDRLCPRWCPQVKPGCLYTWPDVITQHKQKTRISAGFMHAISDVCRIWWWEGTPHQTTIESTESKRCGLLRTGANRIEKPAGTAIGRGRSSGFFALIGRRYAASTSFAFWGQFNSGLGIEPASVRSLPSTPVTGRRSASVPA